MDIFLNGCRTRSSLSPVIMQEALAKTANSRNLLFLGSLHAVKEIVGKKSVAFNSNLFMIDHRSFSSKKYLSNFFLKSTKI